MAFALSWGAGAAWPLDLREAQGAGRPRMVAVRGPLGCGCACKVGVLQMVYELLKCDRTTDLCSTRALLCHLMSYDSCLPMTHKSWLAPPHESP